MPKRSLVYQRSFRAGGHPSIASDVTGRVLSANLAAKRIVYKLGAGSVDAILPDDHARLTAACLKARRTKTAPAFVDEQCLHWIYRRLPRRKVVFAVGYPVSAPVAATLVASRVSEAVLAQLAVGLLVVDTALRIHYANPHAKALLESTWPDQSRDGRLFTSNSPLRHKLEALVKREEGVGVLPRGRRQVPLEILVKQLPGARTDSADSLALICMVDPDYVPPSFPDRLRKLYQLTPTEAEVAAVLRRGARLEDGAEAMGVSRNTVRTHVRKLCRKTGQMRLSELLWCINAGVAMILVDNDWLSSFSDLIQ